MRLARIMVALCTMTAVASAEPASVAERSVRDPDWVLNAKVLGGAGAVVMGSSLVLALAARRQYDEAFEGDCTDTAPPQCGPDGYVATNNAVTRARLATGMFFGGALLAGAGVAVYLLAPRERFAVAPTVGSDGAGVAVSGRF